MSVGVVELNHVTTVIFRAQYVSHLVERHGIATRDAPICTVGACRNMDYDTVFYLRHEQFAGFLVNGNTLRTQEPADRASRGRVS